MMTSISETDEFLVEMDEDVEGLQTTIYLLQQQLKEAKEQIEQLQQGGRTCNDGEHRTEVPQTSSNGNTSNYHGQQESMDQGEEEHRQSTTMDTSENYSEPPRTGTSKHTKLTTDSSEPLRNGMLDGGSNGSSNGNPDNVDDENNM